jgi:hypothetical protein
LQRDATLASVQLPPRYDFSFGAIKSRISFAPGSLPALAQQLGEVRAICDILFRAKVNTLDAIQRVRVSPDDKEMADYIEVQPVASPQADLVPYQITFHCFSTELAGVLTGFATSPHGFRVKTLTVESASGAAPVPAGANPGGEERPVPMADATAPAPTAPVVTMRGGLQTVINEHLLKATLTVELIKLKAAAN